MQNHSRRKFFASALPLTVGAAIGSTHASAAGSEEVPQKKTKLVVVGAHPDDPETMCGGLMAQYGNAGHEVVAIYLTRGEAGIPGKSHQESAKIRMAEATSACKILKARPRFLGQVDGSCEITTDRYAEMLQVLKEEDPDIIVTHWPVDTHRDHRICGMLAYDAWLALESKAALYFGEVMSGWQTQDFAPTDYINISEVIEQKHHACFAHESQKVKETYHESHGKMELFRGIECGSQYAEAFMRHVNRPQTRLL